MKKIVTTNADSGAGTLRQAIIDINNGSTISNVIHLQIRKNAAIVLQSDLPVIKKNTEIVSTGQQTINGNRKYRLFATIMADLTLTNCTLQNGAAIGGHGGTYAGGGMGAGGGVYVDRGNTFTFSNSIINNCEAKGGEANKGGGGGGGASFSTNKNPTSNSGGGDYPGFRREFGGKAGESDRSLYSKGYGGGDSGKKSGKGGGNGPGKGQNGGYCGGGGEKNHGAGGNGGASGDNYSYGGGGGFGSGGGYLNSGGGFGGGGVHVGGGGFGGGGGGYRNGPGKGGRFAGDGISESAAGGGAGIGGAIFIGDTATCLIRDQVSITANRVEGGSGGNWGKGYAPDIFLFRKATIIFENQKTISIPYSMMADQEAPDGHLDSGIVKRGSGQLTLSSTDNNYRGGVTIEAGILSIANEKVLGSLTSPIRLQGGILQVTKTITLKNPMVVTEIGTIHVPKSVVLNTHGKISGSGFICKTGDGLWNHYGDCLESVQIHKEEKISPKSILVNDRSIFQGSSNKAFINPGLGYFNSQRGYKKNSKRHHSFK